MKAPDSFRMPSKTQDSGSRCLQNALTEQASQRQTNTQICLQNCSKMPKRCPPEQIYDPLVGSKLKIQAPDSFRMRSKAQDYGSRRLQNALTEQASQRQTKYKSACDTAASKIFCICPQRALKCCSIAIEHVKGSDCYQHASDRLQTRKQTKQQ